MKDVLPIHPVLITHLYFWEMNGEPPVFMHQ